MRDRIRGATLVEMLVGLVILGVLLASLGSALAVTAKTSARNADRQQIEEDNTAFLRFIQHRLSMVVLAPDDSTPARPEFLIERDRLRFVTRFVPPAPRIGPHLMELRQVDNGVEVILQSWPEGNAEERITLSVDFGGFSESSVPNLMDGLPQAIVLRIAGTDHLIPLGAAAPLGCVLVLPEAPGLPCAQANP